MKPNPSCSLAGLADLRIRTPTNFPNAGSRLWPCDHELLKKSSLRTPPLVTSSTNPVLSPGIMSGALNRLKSTLAHLTETPKYRYTTPDAPAILSAEQLEQYERDGYILVRGLVGRDELNKYKQRFIELSTGTIPKPDSMVR